MRFVSVPIIIQVWSFFCYLFWTFLSLMHYVILLARLLKSDTLFSTWNVKLAYSWKQSLIKIHDSISPFYIAWTINKSTTTTWAEVSHRQQVFGAFIIFCKQAELLALSYQTQVLHHHDYPPLNHDRHPSFQPTHFIHFYTTTGRKGKHY